MARLLKGEKMGDPPRCRRLSFKTKGSERKTGVRIVRKTVPANSVALIASKFNAVVVEDEQKGRAILKKRQAQEKGSVRAAVQKFETLQNPKIVVVRKNSNQPQEEKQKEEVVKPKIHPKPAIDRKAANARYVKKDLKELVGKDKKLSLPKTQILDEILNETEKAEKTTKKPPAVEPKTSKKEQVPAKLNSQQEEKLVDTTPSNFLGNVIVNHQPLEKDSVEQDVQKTVIIEVNNSQKPVDSTQPSKNIKPNSSFLWRAKQPENVQPAIIICPAIEEEPETEVEKVNLENLKESSIDDNDCVPLTNPECQRLVENKENLEKLETPVIRTVDKKGYGKINIQANNSSLYRNILNIRHQQSLIEEIKERVEKREKAENKEVESPPEVVIQSFKGKTEDRNESFLYKNCSERSYELIDQDAYEVVENNYDVIKEYDEEAIYDDVHVNNDRIYESIYNGRIQNDSDSSCEQNNSLYDLRPPSQASSGGSGGAGQGGVARSDTSDDWVDIELDNGEEQREQIIV